MNRRTLRVAAAAVAVALLGGLVFALRGGPAPVVVLPTPTTAPRPTPLGYTPVPEGQVAPAVLRRTPDRGEELRPDGAIELVFDRPMDQGSVAAALTLSPAVAGSVQWPDARTLRFTPSQPLPRASTFDVALSQAAKAADGAALSSPLQFRFNTAGFLEVGQVIPADGAQDVQPGATITVLFNRPVVPLTVVEQQGNAPQPLAFTPAVAGRGEWLNTAVYVFHPSAPLAGGVQYRAQVAAGLQGVDGSPLQSDYSWQFTTARPQVLSVFPQDGEQLVGVERTLSVQLNQPVAQASAEAGFHLRSANGDVPGALQALGDTLIFTPSQRLAYDADYQLVLDAGLGASAGGAGLPSEFRSTFRTVPLPRLLGSLPADGDQGASPYTDFALFFNAPIDPDTVMANLRMTPALSPTLVYTYSGQVYPGDPSVPAGAAFAFHLSFGAQPSSDYRVEVAPGIADPYGNRTAEALDVRFRTAALPPFSQLVMPEYVATYSGVGPARIGISSVNMDSADLTLYRLPIDALRQPYVDPAGLANDTIIRRWRAPLGGPLNQPTLTAVELVEGGGKLAPGVYLLTLSQGANPPQQHLMVVSNVNVTLKTGQNDVLVWATDLQSGQPVGGLRFELFDDVGNPAGTLTTDADGIARRPTQDTSPRAYTVIAREPFAGASSGWSRGIAPWEFGLPAGGGLPPIAMHIYTDRPIYRAGQTVFFKGVVRRERDAAFSPPQGGAVGLTITSASGEQLFQQQLQLNANGAFDGKLDLPAGAALGGYSIAASYDGQSFGAPFQVAAYRAPEFEVQVKTPAAELVRGAPIDATAEVSYFFGGPVANAPVQWNVLADSYRFAPEWGGRYQWGDTDDPWRCWECWWRPAAPPQPILSGSGVTDAQGRLAISIPATLKDAQGVPITDSVRLTIEATVTGRDNQVISGRAELVSHRGQIYLGLAPRAYVAQAGEPQTVDLAASDIASKRQPNLPVDVELVRYSWENRFVADANGGGRWEWSEQQAPVSRQTVTTDANGEASVSFTPAEAGSYRLVATARDAGGRTVRSSIFVWVAGDGYAPWRRDNGDQINLISDRTSYKPGETAEILIPSPFTQPHWALITVERGTLLSHEVRKLDGNSALIRLPITAEHVPNVYVAVTLISPPDAPGRPANFKVGILPLAVEPVPQSLTVALAPNGAATAEPGQTVDFGIQVTDAQGRPVAAELSLDLVDKAVLSLQPRAPDAIREAFYYRRPLGITTASGLAISGDRFLEQFDKDLQRQQQERQQFPTTAGGLDSGAVPAAAPTSSPAAEAPAADMAGGAMREVGKAEQGGPAIRAEFADTAFWAASVSTDASGKGNVQITLPDNLTTWVLRGVGLTADTRVGEGLAELVATKPLLVRPVTPRFFVVGDSVELAANVTNNTAAPLAVQVSLAARGMSVTSALTQTVQVPANGEAGVTWQATAEDVTAADLVFRASAGQYADASKPRVASGPEGTLPVYRYSAPELVGTGGQLTEAGARTEAIGLPPNVDPRNGELTVRLDPSLAAGMTDGLSYLEHFPYECTEQTISRFLPNILTLQAIKKLGLSNSDLEARLPKLVDEGLAKLYAQQNGDGGWGWWPTTPDSTFSASNPHISAYVVFGMLRAKQSGYPVRDDALTRGLDYLAGQLQAANQRADQLASADANQQAWLLYVLAEAGRPDQARLDGLYANREKLSLYARALLALGLNTAGAQPSDGRIKTLLSDLSSAAVLSATGAHWEEQERDWWSMNTDTRTTAIVLYALTRLDQPNQLNPNVVRWLMVARRDGIWETTQETAWALIALTDWMDSTGELGASYDYGVWLNDQQQASGQITPADVQKPVILRTRVADLLKDAGNRLTIGRGAGSGRLYYTAHLRAFLPVDQIKALDRGVVVRRRYTLASCQDGPKCPQVSEVKVGDVIRVELEIVAPHDLYYLQVEDGLPAGAEAIDTSLATTSVLDGGPVLQPPGGPMPIDGPIAVERGGAVAGGPALDIYWPWWRWYSRSELRDEKVALFADHLPRGAYLYSYTMRATQAGEYRVIPTVASELYFPEVYGRGDGQLLRVTR